MTASNRSRVYEVAAALIPLLVAYGLVSERTAPLWLALIAAILSAGPALLARANVTPDTKDAP